MNFEEFRRRAEAIFEEIPPDFRDGIDGLEVLRKTVSHPTLPEVYTLGECLSDFYPSDTGGAGEVRSRIVLYYGAFIEMSRGNESWDWGEELYETITHEIRHHLEHLASERSLEELDWADDQNFARRNGDPFDPLFYQTGIELAAGTFAVGDDIFIERRVDARALGREGTVTIDWHGSRLVLSAPTDLGDVHFLRVPGVELESGGDLYVVLVRRRRLVEEVRGLVTGARPRVLESDGVLR